MHWIVLVLVATTVLVRSRRPK